MYCRNCGKELPDNSNFCPECGTKQNVIPDNKIHIPKFIKEHQKLSYAYVAWCLIHFTLFISSSKRIPEGFYPWNKPLNYMLTHFWEEEFNYSFSLFDKYDVYDFSEFFFYTIIFPIIIFGAFKLYPYVLLYLKRAKEHFIQWKETNAEKEEEHSEILSGESQEKPNDVTSFSLGRTGQSFNKDKEVSGKDGEIDNSDSTLQAYENTINSIDPSGGAGCMTITAIIGCTLLFEFIISIIPYSYLSALPKALIQMAIGLFCVYLVRLYLSSSKRKEDTQEEYTYEELPLYKRFFGSFIDKFIIFFLFVAYYIIAHPFQAPSDLGAYNAILLGVHPSNYEYIDRINIEMGHGYSYLFGNTPYIGQTMNFDIGMTTILVVVYLLYHLIFEATIKASPCKKIFSGILFRDSGEEIQLKEIFYRMLIRGAVFLVAIYGMHIWMESTYFFVFLAMLLFVDIPLFFSHRSTIDLLSGTMYMKRIKNNNISEEQQDMRSDIEENNIVYEKVAKDEIVDSIKNENDDPDEDGMEHHAKRKIFLFILASILFVSSIAIWQYWSDIAKYITDDSTVSPPKDRMCPELIEFEKEYKAKVPFTLVDGIKIVDVVYKDTTFTSFYQMDSDVVPFDKMSAFPEDHKRGALANIEVSTGKTRDNYKKMVEYHVAKVDKYIDKKTGKSVTVIISPKEIDTALKEPLSALGKLEQYIDTQRKMLPCEKDKGLTHTTIEMVEGQVITDISVNEDLYDFHELIEMKDELRANMINQLLTDPISNKFCRLLADAHCGLTYRCYGNQSYLEMFITLDADEIISLLEE